MPTPADPQQPQDSRPAIPEMVGATSAPFEIGPGTTEIILRLQSPTGPARAPEARTPRGVFLQVENVTGDRRAPPFEVYLNLPRNEAPALHPELRAGSLGLFGLVESSDPNAGHGGNGMGFTLDVTALFGRLSAMKDWDPQNLRISFVATEWDAPVPTVRVGRVSLYLL